MDVEFSDWDKMYDTTGHRYTLNWYFREYPNAFRRKQMTRLRAEQIATEMIICNEVSCDIEMAVRVLMYRYVHEIVIKKVSAEDMKKLRERRELENDIP